MNNVNVKALDSAVELVFKTINLLLLSKDGWRCFYGSEFTTEGPMTYILKKNSTMK